MGIMQSYQNLLVWQKSMDLVLNIYKVCILLPSTENFGLSSQMKRCAVSVPSNIAEGYGRNTDNSFSHFLNIAKGSLNELETQLLICIRLSLIDAHQAEISLGLIAEIAKMIHSLKLKLNTNS